MNCLCSIVRFCADTARHGVIGVIFGALLFSGLTQAQEKSLYDRLGGYDAIAAVTDELILRVEDKFSGFSGASKRLVRQNIVDFLCEATGGPCFYNGRDLECAHAGIGISKAQWNNS